MTIAPHSVSPSDIQSELNRIWESLETTSVARASLFNLIFYTQKNHRTPYFEKIAQKVIEKFPSRVIFITVDKTAKEDSLKTDVSILSSSKGEFDVACDYIHIETGGNFHERIPFVVLPHILPDLPVYLVWAEDPSQKDPLSSQLEPIANRLIFDSESADHLPRFAQSLLEQHTLWCADIADLNWARIESWREMLSIAFHSEEKLQQIENAKKITITYNAQETPFFCHTKIQAAYLQAWLACQLNWKFQQLRNEDNTLIFSYKNSKSESLEIALQSTQLATLPPGLVLSLDVLTAQQEHFVFARQQDQLHQITCQYSSPSHCDLPTHYIFSKAESGHSLVKEICRRGSSEHFLKVLNLLKQMDTHGLC